MLGDDAGKITTTVALVPAVVVARAAKRRREITMGLCLPASGVR